MFWLDCSTFLGSYLFFIATKFPSGKPPLAIRAPRTRRPEWKTGGRQCASCRPDAGERILFL